MQRKKNFSNVKIILLFSLNVIFYDMSFLSASVNCKDLFQFLYQNSGLKDILKENIFNTFGAKGINYRSFVTTPIGLYYNGTDAFCNNISGALFYLTTPKGVILGEKNSFSALINSRSLVDLYSDKIINLLQDTPYVSFNAPFLGQAFDYISILQKRIGFSLQGAYQLNNNLFMYAQLPFIYTIYYPSIPSEIQGVISMEVAQFGFNQDVAEQDFLPKKKNSRDLIIEHTVYDTFGLDRSVIGFYSQWCNEIINTELRFLFPGKDIFQNNIGGNYENAKKKIPSLDLKNILMGLIDRTNADKINLEELQSNLLSGFDRVILGSYYNPLSYQTMGISPSLICRIPCNNRIFFDGYLSYVYNFSKQVIGAGMRCYDNQFENEIDFDTISESDACKYLDSFTRILEQKLIPELCSGTLSNGAEYQAALSIRSTVSDMSLALGADFWYRAASLFLPAVPNVLAMQSINAAMQLNGFFNFEYYIDSFCMPFTISCIFQATLYSQGIGAEYGGKIQATMQY
jgi:hypothetical protein